MRGFKSFERVSPQKISERAFVRTVPISAVFTPGEAVDLQVIANVWDTVPKVVIWWLVGNELAKMRGREFFEMPWAPDVRRELVKIGRVHRYDMSPEERQLRAEAKEQEKADPQQPEEDPGEPVYEPADDGDARGCHINDGREPGERTSDLER